MGCEKLIMETGGGGRKEGWFGISSLVRGEAAVNRGDPGEERKARR